MRNSVDEYNSVRKRSNTADSDFVALERNLIFAFGQSSHGTNDLDHCSFERSKLNWSQNYIAILRVHGNSFIKFEFCIIFSSRVMSHFVSNFCTKS